MECRYDDKSQLADSPSDTTVPETCQNRSKTLYTVKQNGELDEKQAIRCPTILDGTIRT